MTGAAGERPRRAGRARGIAPALLLACAASAGCLGPRAIQSTRLRYNEVYRATNDEQLLLNIVRLRYADSPVLVDLPSITSQFELAGGASYNGGFGNQFAGRTSLGFGQLSLRDTPTLSYHPREGREIARGWLTPLTTDILLVVRSGATTEQFLLMAVNDINDVPNAYRATLLNPRTPDDNALFRRGVQILSDLNRRQAIELASGTSEESDAASDPIPVARVSGTDLVNAMKEGYVFRERGGRMTLLKRERELILRVRPEAVHSPEMTEMARIFRMTPGLSRYKVKSELSEEANQRAPEPLNDTIYLNMRSILQIATFLSKGVCVPEEHVACGIAPTIVGPDGRAFDWRGVTAGLFSVRAQRKRPKDAEVAVPYRGYWFFIPQDDVGSRAVLAIYEMLTALQESDDKPAGPLLTLPVSGGG